MLTVLLSCIPLAYSHQDALIELLPNGELRGLPPEYTPAYLLIPPSVEDAPVVLQIGRNRVEFPECISFLFEEIPRRRISIGASWYHDSSTLPSYISIQLPTSRRCKTGMFDGWSLLLALDTGELLKIEAEFETGCYYQRGLPIDLDTFCTPEEVEQLHPKAPEAP